MGNRLAVGAILMLTLFFFGCGKPISGDTVYRFPDPVTEVAVTCYGGGEVAEVTLDAPDALRAVANWYAGRGSLPCRERRRRRGETRHVPVR